MFESAGTTPVKVNFDETYFFFLFLCRGRRTTLMNVVFRNARIPKLPTLQSSTPKRRTRRPGTPLVSGRLHTVTSGTRSVET